MGALTLALSTAGALTAFLLWNRPPARLFLGNGGTYAIGTILSVLAILVVRHTGWRGVVAVGVCLSVFAFEVLFTVVRRLRLGRPVVAGDRLHSYDLLAARAGSRWRSTIVFWFLGAAAAGLGLLVDVMPLWASIPAVAGGGIGVIVWTVRYWGSKTQPARG